MIINKKKFYTIIFFILIFLLFALRFHGTSYKFDPNVCELPMKWKHATGTFETIQSATKDKYCGIEIDINLVEQFGHLDLKLKPYNATVYFDDNFIISLKSIIPSHSEL